MKATARTSAGAEGELERFVSKFDAENQTLIRAVRNALRKRLPTANELVYDNYNFFVIGYSPSARPSDAILSLAADANGVSLYFLYGARLPDPKGLLSGSGSQTRFLRLEAVSVLGRPAVEELVAAAVAEARAPFPTTGRGTLVIRSVSAKQRPRRKPAK